MDNPDPVCVVLKNHGIQHLNPKDPEFTRLKSKEPDTGLWTQAAIIASDSGNFRFDYVLGIVRNKLKDRARPKPVQPAANPIDPALDPDTRAGVEAIAKAKGLQPWDGVSESFPSYKARVRAQVDALANSDKASDFRSPGIGLDALNRLAQERKAA